MDRYDSCHGVLTIERYNHETIHPKVGLRKNWNQGELLSFHEIFSLYFFLQKKMKGRIKSFLIIYYM